MAGGNEVLTQILKEASRVYRGVPGDDDDDDDLPDGCISPLPKIFSSPSSIFIYITPHLCVHCRFPASLSTPSPESVQVRE